MRDMVDKVKAAGKLTPEIAKEWAASGAGAAPGTVQRIEDLGIESTDVAEDVVRGIVRTLGAMGTTLPITAFSGALSGVLSSVIADVSTAGFLVMVGLESAPAVPAVGGATLATDAGVVALQLSSFVIGMSDTTFALIGAAGKTAATTAMELGGELVKGLAKPASEIVGDVFKGIWRLGSLLAVCATPWWLLLNGERASNAKQAMADAERRNPPPASLPPVTSLITVTKTAPTLSTTGPANPATFTTSILSTATLTASGATSTLIPSGSIPGSSSAVSQISTSSISTGKCIIAPSCFFEANTSIVTGSTFPALSS